MEGDTGRGHKPVAALSGVRRRFPRPGTLRLNLEGVTGRGHKPVAALSGSADGFPQPAVFRGRLLPRQLTDFRGYGRALAAAKTFTLGLAAEAFTLGLAAGVAAPLGWVVGWTLG